MVSSSDRGIVGLKSTHVCFQSVRVGESTAAIFDRALRGQTLTATEIRQFQGHMLWYVPQLCREKGLIYQIHTGLQHCFANLNDANPLHLMPMLGGVPGRDLRYLPRRHALRPRV